MIENTYIVIFGLIGLISLVLIVRYLYFLLEKKWNTITIEVKDCKSCPFKIQRDNSYVSCNLKQAIQKDNNWYCNKILMKGTCPIKGNLEININKL